MTQSDERDDILFFEEDSEPEHTREQDQASPWKILIVDDDEEVHVMTRLVLRDLVFENRPVRLFSANSGEQARVLLEQEADICLILLDVVMEQWILVSRSFAARMALQLVAVGYVLVMLFEQPSPWITGLVLTVMISAASWIAIRPVRHQPGFLRPAFIALLVAVGFHLVIALKLVLGVEIWYEPSVMIPLAGMFYANSMNAISLAAERYYSGLKEGKDEKAARMAAFHAAMIPQVNSLLAVGLVALPGMMTGQILAGSPPAVAVKYQILVMLIITAGTGFGAVMAVGWGGRRLFDERERLRLDRLIEP